jgi:hypothetical protein
MRKSRNRMKIKKLRMKRAKQIYGKVLIHDLVRAG